LGGDYNGGKIIETIIGPLPDDVRYLVPFTAGLARLLQVQGMNSKNVFDIRFLAPVGILFLVIFMFSPVSTYKLLIHGKSLDWVVGLFIALAIGFIISSIANFIIRISNSHLSRFRYNFKDIFKLNVEPNDKKTAEELSSWLIVEQERKRVKDSKAPEQIYKRWNVAMANYNCALAIVIGWAISFFIPNPSYSSYPNYIYAYYLILLLFLIVFIYNGEDARRSVLKMDKLLAIRNEKFIFPEP